MLNGCWSSTDDENLKPTYYYDEGHYPHSIQDKPVMDSPSLPSKPLTDFNLMYKSANAKNGYIVMCDMARGLRKDGLDDKKAIGFAYRWLKVFNELNGIEECV